MNKNDLRYIKTERAIRSAFLSLLRDIGFKKINIKKIIDTAEINRTTFYSHYEDKFSLVYAIENDLLQDLSKMTPESSLTLISNHALDTKLLIHNIENIVNYLYENGEMFTLLLNENGDPSFPEKLQKHVTGYWSASGIESSLSIPEHYAIIGMIGMTTNILTEWVRGGFQESTQEFLSIIVKIVDGLVAGLFEEGAL